VTTSPDETDHESSITALALLGDEQRRRLYGFVRREHRAVSREEAAASVGISRKLAAHHLDKLVAAGLLAARYGPQNGIRKVGRAPKLYEVAEASIQVSIPERRHEELSRILMAAVLHTSSAGQAAMRAAAQRGQQLGRAARDRLRPGRLGPERALTITEQLLSEHGFEPARPEPAEIELLNCPFHPLAAEAPELVCGINHAFLGGMLAGLEAGSVTAELRPQPGRCCVRLRARRA
jgi:predicted ArsR family transcriptional regulator